MGSSPTSHAAAVLVLVLVGCLGSAARANVAVDTGVAAVAPSSPQYRARCAVCHGAGGHGDGPAAAMLSPAPRDFTTGVYKFRSTRTGTLPTVADVARTIRTGLPGTSMPGFVGLLQPAEVEALAREVLALAPRSIPPGIALEVECRAVPARRATRPGAEIYASAGCVECHGDDGRGVPWRPEREGLGTARMPTVLAEPWTFRAGRDRSTVARTILTGIDGAAMPAYAGTLSSADACAVAAHVGTLARRPLWEERDPALIRTAGVAADPVERGRYLTRAMMCPLCHTPISASTGAYDAGRFLAGGMRVSAWPWGVWYSRNLTPDAETGLGPWSDEDIVQAITRGISRDGRRLNPTAMPWPWFSRLTPEDARAIANYLKRVPPVRNAVPPRERVPWAERLGGKLLALFGPEPAVEFWGGNAAMDASLRGTIPVPRDRRITATLTGCGVALAAAAVMAAGLVRGRVRHDAPRPVRRSVALAWRAAVIGGATLLTGAAVLAAWPPFALMGPEMTVRWLFLGTPVLPRDLDPAQLARASRGEYLATVAPCGLCHTPARAFVGFTTRLTLAGGMEARWGLFGRAVSTNLTPHRRDGIGSIDDDLIARAVGRGIRHDGRPMHWQAMPWDILSNWSTEDEAAMVAYLRTLPPRRGHVPPPRPPHSGDPLAATLYFGDASSR
jgi:cytochrome c553